MTTILRETRQSTMSDQEVIPWTASPETYRQPKGLREYEKSEKSHSSYSVSNSVSVAGKGNNRAKAAAAIFKPLFALQENWDGYGAAVPTVDAISLAARIVQTLVAGLEQQSSRGLPFPEVLASVDGGVLLEWDGDDVEVQISIDPRQAVSVYVRLDQGNFEGPLSENKEIAISALLVLS